jgi:hypothetical protein
MASSVTFDPSITSSQRATLRSTPAAGSRLLNRLTGIRNSESAGGPAPTGPSEAEEPRSSVVRAHPSASSGDLLETLPDVELAHKQNKDGEKKVPLSLIPSRLEIRFLSNTRKAQTPYDAEELNLPHLDIRV